jgi:hypothetical protein
MPSQPTEAFAGMFRNFLCFFGCPQTGLIVAPFDPLNLTDDYKRQSEV